MWSVGCIFAELLLKEPLFQAKAELELLSMIFKLLGPPTSTSWPGYSSLPVAKTISLPSPQPHQFRQKFQHITSAGIDLLMSFLTYDPERRISAEDALEHPYFTSVHGFSSVLLAHWITVKLPYRNIPTYFCLTPPQLQEKSEWVSYLYL